MNHGLEILAVRSLFLGDGELCSPSDQSLYTGTYSGAFRFEDDGRTWQQVSRLSLVDLPVQTFSERIQLVTSNGEIELSRPGIGSFPWATCSDPAPSAFTTEGHQVTLYAPAGAAMILRAEAPLPLIWSAPKPYLALVMAIFGLLNCVG